MKETMQNINDFIAALAEDIEEIKSILKSRDADSDKILQQLRQAVLEPLQTLCNDKTKELKAYQLSLAQAIVQTLIEKLGGKEIPAPTQDSLHRESVFARFKSAWSKFKQLLANRPACWYRNPYTLCRIGLSVVFITLFCISWVQWHYYRTENLRLKLAADKYRVDSVILHEVYPQAAITLSGYEHITESDGADEALQTFRGNVKALKNKSQ